MTDQPVQLDTLHVQVQEVALRKLPGGPDRMFIQTDGTGKVLVDFADGVSEWGEALQLDEERYEALRKEAFQRELADLQDIPTYTELYPPAGRGGAITSPNGNTLGRVNGETPAMGKAANDANAEVDSETPAEGVTGEQALDGIQLGLDIVGLIPVVGEIADVANAGISLSRGDYAGAALSLLSAIPFVGYLGTAGKVGRHSAKPIQEASTEVAKKTYERSVKETTESQAKNTVAGIDGSGAKVLEKAKSLRERYLGRTPGKKSKTGREVQERMRHEGKLQDNPYTGKPEFMASDGKWYDLSKADMAHKEDAVVWWNRVGRKHGAKSPKVREWMLKSDNYYLEHRSINRSRGAITGQKHQYDTP
ncbi:GH-E family nuclease [Pseudomonas putida]|uniref:GH-E family nuclease n=1 Tax=Pseudomonas putida TaxID=303 RepID=UPI00226DF071|nr:GH-E family nuclease [Pseudomonas putida]WAB96302.1 GH-E family nuclease [Pseudomonas putida]